MITKETQSWNVAHLTEVVTTQCKVRNCEIEGPVFNLGKDLETACNLGLINSADLQDLLDLLEGKGR